MRIGTASVRRKAQLLAHDPSLSIEPLRGNVDTRLRKRGERGLDAIVLAAAGLDRLGLADEIGLRLDPALMLPEAGQGAVALQVRAGEEELVSGAGDAETQRRVELERACVARIGGGCLAPGRRASRRNRAAARSIAAEDGTLGRAALRRRSARARRRAPGGGRVRIALTRAEGGNDALAALLADEGFERGRVPACGDRAPRGTACSTPATTTGSCSPAATALTRSSHGWKGGSRRWR